MNTCNRLSIDFSYFVQYGIASMADYVVPGPKWDQSESIQFKSSGWTLEDGETAQRITVALSHTPGYCAHSGTVPQCGLQIKHNYAIKRADHWDGVLMCQMSPGFGPSDVYHWSGCPLGFVRILLLLRTGRDSVAAVPFTMTWLALNWIYSFFPRATNTYKDSHWIYWLLFPLATNSDPSYLWMPKRKGERTFPPVM